MSNSSHSFLLIAAAAAAAAATTAVYAFTSAKTRGVTHCQHHFNVPHEILKTDCPCKQELILAVRLALEGEGARIKHLLLVSCMLHTWGLPDLRSMNFFIRNFFIQRVKTWPSITTTKAPQMKIFKIWIYPAKAVRVILQRRLMLRMKILLLLKLKRNFLIIRWVSSSLLNMWLLSS